MIAPEIPTFDLDSHAMAMDRRPLGAKLVDQLKKVMHKDNASANQPVKQPPLERVKSEDLL